MGTLFAPLGRRPSARQFWLRYASRPRGRLLLDEGAVRAVRERHASLLAAGITGLAGDFLADDPVELVGPDGVVVARGLVAYDAREMPDLLGRKTGDLAPEYRREVVHRDEMVLVGRRSRDLTQGRTAIASTSTSRSGSPRPATLISVTGLIRSAPSRADAPATPAPRAGELVRGPVHEVEGHLGDVVERAADGVEGCPHVHVRLLDLRGEVAGTDGGAVGGPGDLAGQVDGARSGRHRHLSVELRGGDSGGIDQLRRARGASFVG